MATLYFPSRFTSPYHSLKHRALVAVSSSYRAAAARAAAIDRAEFRRECLANDWAAHLRTMGYAVPVGTVLFGVTVTR